MRKHRVVMVGTPVRHERGDPFKKHTPEPTQRPAGLPRENDRGNAEESLQDKLRNGGPLK